jgi:hypothetical protein
MRRVITSGGTVRYATLACCVVVMLAATAAGGERVTVDGVLHVKNGATPSGGTETMQLKELWRAGGDDDESVLFGLIAQALVDDDGNVYLLDTQLNHVEVFAPDGRHLKTLGREGDGPGEFRQAFDMVFMPDGTLGVAQVFPGKLVKLSLDGTPAGEYRPTLGAADEGGFLVLVNCLGAGGNLVFSGIDIAIDQEALTQTRTYFLKSFGPDGAPRADLHSDIRVWDFNNFTLREASTDYCWGRVGMGTDGRVAAVIPRNEYAITVFGPDGSIERIIEREYRASRRNDRSRARATAALEGQIRQFPPGTPYEIDDHDAAIMAVFVRDDGAIWAMTNETFWNPKDGVLKTYDVFDREGDFIKQIDVAADGVAWNDALVFAGDDQVLQITGFFDALNAAVGGMGGDSSDDEAAPMEVICYRIE